MSYSSVALSEIAIINPSTPSTLSQSDEVAFLPMAAVDADHAEVVPVEVRLASDVRNGFSYFSDGDILVAKITPCFENGKIAIACLKHHHGFGSTEFHVIRPSAGKLDPRFLVYYLRQEWLRHDGERKMTGSAGQRRLPKHFLENLLVPLPPFDEQRRIAAILDAADALRVKRRAALAKLDDLAQSIFDETFQVPEAVGWNKLKLTEIFDFRTGKLDSNAAVSNGQYPFFTCSREDFWIDTYAFDCEALLLAGNNANADYSVKYYKGKFNAYQRTYVITLKNSANSYAYAHMALQQKLTDLKRYSKGTNTKYLTMEIFNDLSIILPPSPMQQTFENKIRNLNALKSQQVKSLAALNDLFGVLQHRAFRGKL